MWMEIELARDGADLRISARGSREEHPKPHRLDPVHTGAVSQFAAGVRAKALQGRPLGELVETARELHRAVLRDDLSNLRARLLEAAGGEPIVLRLALSEEDLQATPWEALCEPGSDADFWASSGTLLPVRSVSTNEPWQPREVRGAVKVLAIAPSGAAALEGIEAALKARIASGEVEWLNPIVGDAVSPTHLFERLRREAPHVIHFVGHGGVQAGVPVIQFSEDKEERWLSVGRLGQHLKASFGSHLRLVVLEACEGAMPGAFASAAETLARCGADAVIAHLWPVRAHVARCCSEQLYKALAGKEPSAGDVARSLNEARRMLLASFEESAEAFSPVLYLRAPRATLFDFEGRQVTKPAPRAPVHEGTRAIDPALDHLISGSFSLVLGDRWKADRPALDAFRLRLHEELAKLRHAAPASLPMSALAQRFALRHGADTLEAEFQSAFPTRGAVPPLLAALSSALRAGVHTTLLRTPVLERALAEHRPDQTIYAIQPDRESTAVLRREAGGARWERLTGSLPEIDPDKDIVVLRLYRGYRPDDVYSSPLLTEDDYLMGFRELERALPSESADDILDALATQPALLLGVSLHTWHHRMLLYRLFGKRPLPRRSLAVVDPEDAERELWERGTSLPGKEGVAVLEASAEELAAWVEGRAQGGRR